jgi:hypothetical protein
MWSVVRGLYAVRQVIGSSLLVCSWQLLAAGQGQGPEPGARRERESSSAGSPAGVWLGGGCFVPSCFLLVAEGEGA